MKASLSTEIVAPLVMRKPMPRSAYIVASVMMNGGRPICVTPKAWKRPIKTPIASEIATAPATDEAKPRWLASNKATVIEMKPAIAPTERSMPPVMMVKVSPMARIAIIAPWRRRLDMLFEVQKVVVANDSASHRMSSRTRRVRPSSTFSRRLRRSS